MSMNWQVEKIVALTGTFKRSYRDIISQKKTEKVQSKTGRQVSDGENCRSFQVQVCDFAQK